MVVFLVLFLALLALNALLLIFSSNRRFRVKRPATMAEQTPAKKETYPLGSFDSNYQKAV